MNRRIREEGRIHRNLSVQAPFQRPRLASEPASAPGFLSGCVMVLLQYHLASPIGGTCVLAELWNGSELGPSEDVL